MNKEWNQHIIREQLLTTVQERFGDEHCLFQHDGAPCHPRGGWTNKQPTNPDKLQALIMQEWAAISGPEVN
jgi:hypothetical protein